MKLLIFLLAWTVAPAATNLIWAQPATPKPSFTATLVDAEQAAKKKAATVEVTVIGIQLVDPPKPGEKPVPGHGHLHYQVDEGFTIATTASKLSFQGLTSGTHKITVGLAADDHSPVGSPQVLTVTIP
jgi:hypothetical protein